jgi:tetratricopeptide (TPR) repeat protein
LWLVPLLAAAAAHAPALWGELVWDDQVWLAQRAHFRTLRDVFWPPAGIPGLSNTLFRPLLIGSYLLDERLYGPGTAFGPHLSNIIFNSLTAVGLYFLLKRLLARHTGGTSAALVAATLFAVHPIHTESVNWVAGRTDVLAAMFLLPALRLALAWQDRRSPLALVLASLCYLLALFAKEVAVAGVLLLPVVLVAAEDPADRQAGNAGKSLWSRWRTRGVVLTLFAAVTVLYLWLREQALLSPPVTIDRVPWEWLLPMLRATGFYFGKLVYPWPQSHFLAWDDVPGIGGTFILLAAACTIAAWAIWLAWRRQDRLALLGVFWIAVTISPVLILAVAVIPTPVAERYLYLPSAGFVMLVATLLAQLHGRRIQTAALGTCVLLAATWFNGTIIRGLVWQTDLALWSSVTDRGTRAGMPWLELGKARFRSGDEEGALAAFQRATTLDNHPNTLAIEWYNVGLMLLRRDRVDDAERAFREALIAYPDYAWAHYGMGNVAYARGQQPGETETRLAHFRIALLAYANASRYLPSFGEPRLQSVRVRLAEAQLRAAAGDAQGAAASLATGRRQLANLLQRVPGLSDQAGIRELAEALEKQGLQQP